MLYSFKSSKYRSREIPAVRRLFLMMNTGTNEYLGITTGRSTPALVKTRWSPSCRIRRKPPASNTRHSSLYDTGQIFGMREWDGQGNSLDADGLWNPHGGLGLLVACLFQDGFQVAHLFSLFQEQADRLLQVGKSLFLGATTGRDVQLLGMGHESSAFSNDVGSELNLHTSSLIMTHRQSSCDCGV